MSGLRWCGFVCVAWLALLGAGCGSSTVKITGELRKGGNPMIVPENTYVTLSFIPADTTDDSKRTSYSAKFEHKSGTYAVELPPGNYRTKILIAPPADPGKVSMPGKPIDSPGTHDLSASKKLDLEVPAK